MSMTLYGGIMLRLSIFTISLIALTGCASTTGTFFNRPVVEDKVGEVMHTVSLSADRRTVIVAARGSETPKFCAEPPPDTATALKTDLDSTFKKTGIELGIKDKFDTSVTVLSARNAPLDAFRTGMFALCQFYLNGAIPAEQVPQLFSQLLDVYQKTQNLVTEVPKPKDATAGTQSPSGAMAATALSTRKAEQ